MLQNVRLSLVARAILGRNADFLSQESVSLQVFVQISCFRKQFSPPFLGFRVLFHKFLISTRFSAALNCEKSNSRKKMLGHHSCCFKHFLARPELS